jgi:hypothetical protein
VIAIFERRKRAIYKTHRFSNLAAPTFIQCSYKLLSGLNPLPLTEAAMASPDPTIKADDERTPLLATNGTGTTAQPNEEPLLHSNGNTNEEDEDKPIPWNQIFLLCYARVVEPIAFFAIFPFINKMIYETGNVDVADVGFYSGLIVCSLCFCLCE